MDAPLDSDEAQEDTLSMEERAVRVWRYRQMRQLGLDWLEARLVAESETDIGVLRRLVDRGCPPQVAFRIVL